jgi:hypothetical protein
MSDNENVEAPKAVSKEFVNSIKKWVALDDSMKKLRDELKLITNEKKESESIILEELDKMDIKILEITDGKLRKNISKTQGPLKKEHITKTLDEFTKDNKKTLELIEYMMNSRQTVERVNLKRTRNKTEAKLKKILEKSD